MALDRLTPTAGPKTGSAYATEVQEEVTGLWDRSTITLTAVAGTDTITATATPALTGSLGGSMNFILKPAATNTGAVTLNINGSGAVGVVDAEGTALTAGALRINANYFLHYDSGISKYVIVNYVPAAAVPVGSKFIKTQVASSSGSIDFVNGVSSVVFDSTYEAYEFVLSNIKPATNDVILYLRVGTGGGPTYQATNYTFSGTIATASAIGTFGATGLTGLPFVATGGGGTSLGTTAGQNLNACARIGNPAATDFQVFLCQSVYNAATGSGPISIFGGGNWTTAAAITAVRFVMSSGNIASGRFSLYGLTKS